MKIYIIAGEVSGDIYGAQIISSLKQRYPETRIRFWGGDAMLKEDSNIVKHIKETSFMGFIEVVNNIGKIRKNFALCKTDILHYKPDVLLFIDYPGFNLRIAGWAKTRGVKTAYYIAPKVWAWKESRIKKIKQYVDKLYVIFPFEVAYFAKHGVTAEYFGNPLYSRIEAYKKNNPVTKQGIALLPGSRDQEIKRHLPLMYAFATKHPDREFLLPMAQGYDIERFWSLTGLKGPSNIMMLHNSWEVLNQVKYAIVASGTATLETMLFDVPQVVIYKANPISYFIAKRLLKIKFISLVNIIANNKIIEELIQHEATLENIAFHINQLDNPKTLLQYTTVKESLDSSEDPIALMVKDLYSTFS